MRHYSFFLILFLWLFSENANAEYFVIRDYKVDIQVFGDQGMFQVNEEITVEFNEIGRAHV